MTMSINHRRLIPPSISAFSGGVALYFALTDYVTEKHWLEWSVGILAVLFLFKSGLFFWMRQTMNDNSKHLTVFGYALVDFFTSLVVGDIFLVYLFGSTWYAIYRGHDQASFFDRMVGRSGLIGATIFVVATGVAVGYEMRKARGHVSVHEEDSATWRYQSDANPSDNKSTGG